jgi:SAM-dependent methyltransferase
MDIRAYNREAWNREVESGNRWTVPVSSEQVQAARRGQWEVLLTPIRAVPKDWFPDIADLEVLCLASGGGQQGPILAAAGARVTVFDNSPNQLARDRMVAERDGLVINTLEGDMADLSIFPNDIFDLIFHPVSNVFVPDVRPVWKEAYRVLKTGGSLMAGFMNPALYIFDLDLMDDHNTLEVKYSIPYSDLTSPSEEYRKRYRRKGWPLEFGHSLEDQIGGQIEAGFMLTGFYEDVDDETLLARYLPIFVATCALKPPKQT